MEQKEFKKEKSKRGLNIVDYIIILIILALMIGLGVRYAGKLKGSDLLAKASEQKILLTVEVVGQTIDVTNGIKQGDLVRFSDRDKKMGTIVDVKKRPTEKVMADNINGVFIKTLVPDRYDSIVTIEADAIEKEEYIEAGKIKVAIGQMMSLRNKDFGASGWIISMKMK
ncbi:MAG: DUF4330 family protein [Hyphomonadaceae bacterium]|nr:DUF4330 family protein [Clostridia bacterium]